MRLINADKLIRTVRFLTLRSGEQIEIHYVEANRIENAQTIEAIPVEWIKKYMSRCLAIEQDAIGEMVKEWAERKEE